MFSTTLLLLVRLVAVSWASPIADIARVENRAASFTGLTLRILPLGDSITWGVGSSDGNGYRLPLLNQLGGNYIQYIGSLRSGNMLNNQNEGHRGYIIKEISDQAVQDFPKSPDVVMVMAGTNDISRNNDVTNAPARLGALIDRLIANLPNAAILVATITPVGNSAGEARRQTFNAAIPGLIAARTSAGHHVQQVDMTNLAASDLSDGLHPNDHGFQLMAQSWLAGLNAAASKGWLPSTCAYWQSKGSIASGVGAGAGVRFADINGDSLKDYVFVAENSAATLYQNPGPDNLPHWIGKGSAAAGVGTTRDKIFFADVNCDGYDDYIAITASGDISIWYNNKCLNCWDGPHKTTFVAGSFPPEAIRMADINGDSCSDLLAIDANGRTTAWLNKGGSTPSFGPSFILATGVGRPRAEIQFGDFNGDGKADYLAIDATSGAVRAWINGGSNGIGGWNWKSIGNVAAGVGRPGSEVVLADVTGDGRVDYLTVNPASGQVNAWFWHRC